MATGALYSGKCFATQAEAIDAYYSEALPAFTSGATSYMAQYVKVSGVWQIHAYTISGAGVMTSNPATVAPLITFPDCTIGESFFDGVALGWLVAGAIVAAWSIKQMQKGL